MGARFLIGTTPGRTPSVRMRVLSAFLRLQAVDRLCSLAIPIADRVHTQGTGSESADLVYVAISVPGLGVELNADLSAARDAV
jgi:hypothetical protein